MTDSSFEPARLRKAELLLAEQPRKESMMGLAAAAAFFAAAAIALVALVLSLPSPWPM